MKKLKKLMENALARKILEFFAGNPGSLDSASGVAAWVHADRDEVKDLLEEMAELGVLEMDMTGGTQGYSFTCDKEMIKTVEKVLAG